MSETRGQCNAHSVNNRTVEQQLSAASRPPLGCRAFITWSHFL